MKKRLAFSCSGEGFGHIARIAALSEFLKDEYDLFYFIPESVQGFLLKHHPEMEERIVSVPSFNFYLKGHRVDYLKTIVQNIPLVGRLPWMISDLSRQLREKGIDALICDFEPLVSRSATRISLPVLNLNHPAIVLRFFSLRPSALSAQAVAAVMTPPAQETMLCSFYNGDVGPIIRKELQTESFKEDFILVYAKKSSREEMLEALQMFPETRFEVFPRLDSDKNLDKGDGDARIDFGEALVRCKAVIAPAGHQLLSEALYLKKPVLAFPQEGQFEQLLNARMLEKSGCGMMGKLKDVSGSISHYMENLDSLYQNAPDPDFFNLEDNTERILNRIHRFVERETSGKVSSVKLLPYYQGVFEDNRRLEIFV